MKISSVALVKVGIFSRKDYQLGQKSSTKNFLQAG